jgi:serine/threonine protein kinase
MKGQIGGRYRAEVSLFGQCFRAVDEVDGSLVILKVLPDEPDGHRLLTHEFETCSTLEHKNIIRYHGILSESGFTILVARHREAAEFQSVAGPPTEASLTRDTVGLSVFHQLQDGLDYLHGQGWVHAGLARDSVILDRSGKVTIANLVHCCRSAGAQPLSLPDDHGRLMHGSPEHLTGAVAPESDYFAVGVLMFEYLLRRHPFWRIGIDRAFKLLESDGADRFLVDPQLYNTDRKILGMLFSYAPEVRRAGWELLREMETGR